MNLLNQSLFLFQFFEDTSYNTSTLTVKKGTLWYLKTLKMASNQGPWKKKKRGQYKIVIRWLCEYAIFSWTEESTESCWCSQPFTWKYFLTLEHQWEEEFKYSTKKHKLITNIFMPTCCFFHHIIDIKRPLVCFSWSCSNNRYVYQRCALYISFI